MMEIIQLFQLPSLFNQLTVISSGLMCNVIILVRQSQQLHVHLISLFGTLQHVNANVFLKHAPVLSGMHLLVHANV